MASKLRWKFWKRSRSDADFAEEIASHLQLEADELRREGMSAERAQFAARKVFGNVTARQEHFRQSRRFVTIDSLARDVRYAARTLRRSPTFTAAVVLTLALGIGATTAVFSVVNGVLLRPLPYPESNRLVSLRHTIEVGQVSSANQSDASFLLYQAHARVFENMAVWRTTNVNLPPVSASAQAQRVPAATVSATVFDVLRSPPALGRGFRSGEDRVGAPPVVILSHELWQQRYNGSNNAIGQQFNVNGIPREIVAVMPPHFDYPEPNIALWMPIPLDPLNANAGSFNYTGVARLQRGVTVQTALTDLKRVLPRLLDEYPSGIPRGMWEGAHVQPVVEQLKASMVGDVSRMLWILLGSVSLVLVIACANVTNLILVRGEARQTELAVRSALGSGLRGIVTLCLSESLVLAAWGGVAGFALAVIGVRLLSKAGTAMNIPRLQEVTVNSAVLLFAACVTAVCALFVSVLPVLRARRVPGSLVLRSSERGQTADRSRRMVRSALVVALVAMALVLVAASGLLGRSFAKLRDVQPGFQTEGVFVSRIALPRSVYATPVSTFQMQEKVLRAVRAIPGVREASLTSVVPLTTDRDDSAVWVEDHPLPPDAVPRVHAVPSVDVNYFRTMRIPMISGRMFELRDPAKPTREVVVSHAFAKRYWPNTSALGKRIRRGLSDNWYTIVGEVGDVHFTALERAAEDAVYFPMVTEGGDNEDVGQNFVTVVAQTSESNAQVLSEVRRAVHELDPALPTYGERSLSDIVSAASAQARTLLVLLAIASAIALALGAVGIYGVMAYGVSLRQREIGVRIALGARPTDVSRMISRNGVQLAAGGVLLGVACAIAVTRLLSGLLFEISPTDPLTLGATCLVLMVVALFATWIPARRAAAVDPVEALR